MSDHQPAAHTVTDVRATAESDFHQHETDTIPATGADHDRFERTRHDDGFLRFISEHHDLDASGATTPEGTSPCATS